MIKHENFWRPPYEGIAAFFWFLGAAGCFWIGRLHAEHTIGYLGVFCFPMLFLGLLRLLQVFRIWNMKARMWSAKPAFGVVTTALRKQRSKKGHTWLGRGFSWEPLHARRVKDIAALDEEATKPPAAYLSLLRMLGTISSYESKGYHYLHGVGDKERDLFVSDDALGGHTYIVGTSGSGKTRLLEVLIAQAIARGGAVIVLDPKGDTALRDRCWAETVRRSPSPRKDFRYCSPTFPEASVRLNPLANFNRDTQVASRIAALLPSGGNSEAFKNFCWQAINVVVDGLQLSGQQVNLSNLRRYIEGEIDGLLVLAFDAYFDTISLSHPQFANWESAVTTAEKKLMMRPKANEVSPDFIRAQVRVGYYRTQVESVCPSPAIKSMVKVFETDREFHAKLIQNLLPLLQQLTAGALEGLLSPNPLDPDDWRPMTTLQGIVDTGSVLYVNLDTLGDSTVGSALGSLLLADLTAVASHRYSHAGEEQPPVSVFVDEAAELINEPFVQALNKGRGAGFQLYIASQTIADFVAKMGDQAMAMQVLGNTNTTIALRIQDPETREFVSTKMGETRHVQVEISKMNTTYNPAEEMDWGSSHSKRTTQSDIPLVEESVLGKLPDLHFFASLPGGRLVKGRTPILRLKPHDEFTPSSFAPS